ncbi:hypothetical protein SISSUDRAFT_710172 [Sistotremastrum suecicum HHB10207 ss-3]|uniref:Uncharacterized protein n=1 Tax=Sistotremastrum suecicum HHB10207 ss-3 TaxID=1314776 RepID=A0A166DRC4_9AGAM|nr:hypothetical protein SISSUDRAFT_710172 [Sistotremastrum suecicum HHB10207 ss-3]
MSLVSAAKSRRSALRSPSIFTSKSTSTSRGEQSRLSSSIASPTSYRGGEFGVAEVITAKPEHQKETDSGEDGTDVRLVLLLESLGKPPELESQTFINEGLPPHILLTSKVASFTNTASIDNSLPLPSASNSSDSDCGWAHTTSSEASASIRAVANRGFELMQDVEPQETETPEVASPTGSRWSDSEDEERTYLSLKPRKGSSSSKLRLKRSIAAIGKAFRRGK